MINQLLPTGNVVTLKDAEKKLLIIGITVEHEELDKVYDYIAVPFPEGYIDQETMLLFDHKDIEKIEFIGFVNADFQAFRAEYEKRLEEMQSDSARE